MITNKLSFGVSLSVVIHVGVLWGISGIFKPASVGFDDPPLVELVRGSDVAEVELQQAVAPHARHGSRSAAVVRPADTFAPSRTTGSLGSGRSRPSTELTVGDDLDHLRFRPYDHPFRNSPARSPRSRRASTIDNDEIMTNPRRSRSAPLRTVARAVSVKLDPSPEQEAAVENSKRSIEILSKIAKDGRVDRDQLAESKPKTQAMRRALASDSTFRQRASSKKLTDVLDTAAPNDRGQQRGVGRGAVAGRKGNPGGARRGLPLWLDTTDAKYVSYFRKIYRKIQPLWRFPKDLAVLFEQGDVLVQFSVSKAGQVTDVTVKKPSGYPRFDHNAIAAIRGAAPFPPIPQGLGPRLEILAPFEFHNPMIR